MDANDGMKRLHRILTCDPPRPQEQLWNWKQDRLPLKPSIRARGSSYAAWPASTSSSSPFERLQPSYPVDAEYFGAYCMDGLCMALWALWNSRGSYENAMLRAVNLLGDADTVAAICGQMAGAFYGYTSMVSVVEERSGKEIHSKNRKMGQLSSAMVKAHHQWDPLCETALRAILLYYVRETIDSKSCNERTPTKSLGELRCT